MGMTRKEAIVSTLSAGSFTTHALQARIAAATGRIGQEIPVPSIRRAISELRDSGYTISFKNRHYTLEEFPQGRPNVQTEQTQPQSATL